MSAPRHDLYPHLPGRGTGAIDAALNLLFALSTREPQVDELLASARAELEHLIPAGPLLALVPGGDARPLRCPYCGAELGVETETTGNGWESQTRVESIECDNVRDCRAVWEPDGTPRDSACWIAHPDLYDPPAPIWEQR